MGLNDLLKVHSVKFLFLTWLIAIFIIFRLSIGVSRKGMALDMEALDELVIIESIMKVAQIIQRQQSTNCKVVTNLN